MTKYMVVRGTRKIEIWCLNGEGHDVSILYRIIQRQKDSYSAIDCKADWRLPWY